MNNFFNTWSSLTGVTASMEDNVMLPSGLEVEIELDYYGRLTDINEVIKLSSKVEDQEQWSARNRANGSQIRVRQSIIDGGSPSYELTFKGVKVDGAVPESNVEINAQFFFGFKESFATSGMIKTRYSIPFEHEGHSLCWEVDVFEGTDWVKIDLELPNKEITLPTSFPFGITEVMRGGSDKTVRTEEQQKQLDSLFTDHFAVSPEVVSYEKVDASMEGMAVDIKRWFRRSDGSDDRQFEDMLDTDSSNIAKYTARGLDTDVKAIKFRKAFEGLTGYGIPYSKFIETATAQMALFTKTMQNVYFRETVAFLNEYKKYYTALRKNNYIPNPKESARLIHTKILPFTKLDSKILNRTDLIGVGSFPLEIKDNSVYFNYPSPTKSDKRDIPIQPSSELIKSLTTLVESAKIGYVNTDDQFDKLWRLFVEVNSMYSDAYDRSDSVYESTRLILASPQYLNSVLFRPYSAYWTHLTSISAIATETVFEITK